VIAAEPENRSFQFGNFEVIAVQDALSAMRFKLFPGMLEEEFLRLTGGGRVDIFSETVSFHFSRMQFPREIYQFGRNFHQVCQPDSIACKKLKRMESPLNLRGRPGNRHH
jgi:hypothetical protein